MVVSILVARLKTDIKYHVKTLRYSNRLYIYGIYGKLFEYLFLLYLDIEFIIWYESFMKIGKLVNCEEWISSRQFSCMHEHKNEMKGSMKMYVALFVVWKWFVIAALVMSIAIDKFIFWTLTRVIKTDSSTFFQFRSGRVNSLKFGRNVILSLRWM